MCNQILPTQLFYNLFIFQLTPTKTVTTRATQQDLSLTTLYLKDSNGPQSKVRVALWGSTADRLQNSLSPGMALSIENATRDIWAGEPNVNTHSFTNVTVCNYSIFENKYYGYTMTSFYVNSTKF
jgi:hypothetical protein